MNLLWCKNDTASPISERYLMPISTVHPNAPMNSSKFPMSPTSVILKEMPLFSNRYRFSNKNLACSIPFQHAYVQSRSFCKLESEIMLLNSMKYFSGYTNMYFSLTVGKYNTNISTVYCEL
jgi:hypothetical protein